MAEMTPEERDFWGGLVRMVWIEWAKEQPQTKPSWLVPYKELPEPLKEVDRRIAEKVREVAYPRWDEAISDAEQAAYERAAKVARKRAQRHADAANASKRKGMSIDATYESHRAKTAKEIEDEIRALGKETEG